MRRPRARVRWQQAAALAAGALAVAGGAGCLEPLGSERPGYSAELRAPGARIAAVEDDEVLGNRIANNDGVDDAVPLRAAFAAGRVVRYWDFGSASRSIEPLWTFVRAGDDGEVAPIDHPDLIDSVPGDDAYSPLREIYTVRVTGAYAGERITSLRALEDAIELGLLREPEASGSYVHRPVVAAEVELSAPDGAPPGRPEPVYYRGRVARFLRLGGGPDGEDERVFEIGMGRVATPHAYALRRRHQSSELDEALWEADLDGDGDRDDSNLVFAVDASAPGYSGLWLRVEVIVPEGYAFGDSRAEGDLFERTEAGLQARPDAVLTWQVSEEIRHLVIADAEPAPDAGTVDGAPEGDAHE